MHQLPPRLQAFPRGRAGKDGPRPRGASPSPPQAGSRPVQSSRGTVAVALGPFLSDSRAQAAGTASVLRRGSFLLPRDRGRSQGLKLRGSQPGLNENSNEKRRGEVNTGFNRKKLSRSSEAEQTRTELTEKPPPAGRMGTSGPRRREWGHRGGDGEESMGPRSGQRESEGQTLSSEKIRPFLSTSPPPA